MARPASKRTTGEQVNDDCPPVVCCGCGKSLAGVPLRWGRPLFGIGWVHYGGEWGRRCYDLTDPAYVRF